MKPNEFRNEFIKFSYKQILKDRSLETLDKNQLKEHLNDFSNEAIDDPYKNTNRKTTIILPKPIITTRRIHTNADQDKSSSNKTPLRKRVDVYANLVNRDQR